MSEKYGFIMAKAAFSLTVALSLSTARAESPASPDDILASSVKAALHHDLGANGAPIRVQVVDSVVYLYGVVDTYPERASIDDAAKAAAQGHKVVDSIEFSPS